MKSIRKGFAVALAAAFIALTVCSDAYAAGKNDNKTALKKQNELLRSELDSLKAELERYRMELRRTDSLANEIIDFYQESKPAGDTCAVEYTAEVSDSLLNLWYMHRLVSEENLDYMDIDSVKFQSNVPDSVYIERIAKMNSFITLPYNDIVKNYIIKYSEKMPTAMGRMLGLCDYYMPQFQEILNRYDMPEELKAMAIIESAMNPLAVSRV